MRSLIEAEQAKHITRYEAELEKMKALVEAEQKKLDALKTFAMECAEEKKPTTEKREEFRKRLQAITKENGEGFTCGCDDPLGDFF